MQPQSTHVDLDGTDHQNDPEAPNLKENGIIRPTSNNVHIT